MTSHKHSFQCFDAVIEKPSSTTVHNFVVPHKNPFTSTHLEQLENHRCSLCSESQQAKPVTSEVTGNQSAPWYQPQSPRHQHTPRRPMWPEGDPVYGVAHHHHNHHQRRHHNHTHRHCKRIVLVKNSNPSIQKTILLHRKPVHSLGVFMDDVSELMQCLIRKLYTLDGHKVDSVQSLLQGPGVLVCVGREPFHPLLLDGFQSNSEDKLPKLILKSKSSTCNEDQGYKKNVNFGLNSKKSVPPDPFPKARENILDDDIKKRVLVNKDGSLSVEMKVCFRLLNDETLHCSTEVKKSSCTFNVSFPRQDNVPYPHCGHCESRSEAESLSASEADDVYFTRLYQKHMEEPHCQHCCTHCQEYDIWKNPALGEQETLRHFGSTSSSASSHKIKCKKESVDSVHTTSCEEYTEQVVENSTCIQQTAGERYKGDKVQYRTISRCCSRSEVCSVSTKAKISGCTDEKYGQNESNHAFTEEEKKPSIDHMRVQITQASTVDERPLSVETDSSDILASLKEDEDKEETDLSYSPSNSRVSQSNKDTDEQTRNAVVGPYSFTPCKPPESPKQSLSTRTSSTASCCSVKSKTSRKVVVTETQENVELDKNNPPSSTPHRCQYIESPDVAIEKGTSGEKLEAIKQSEDFDENDALDTETFQTNEKGRSNAMSTPPNPPAVLTISSTYVGVEQEYVNATDAIVRYSSEEENIETTLYATTAESNTSESPVAKNKPNEPADTIYEEEVASAKSSKSNVSARSSWRRLSEAVCKERKKTVLQKGKGAQSVMSVHSNVYTTVSEQNNVCTTVSELLANGIEGQTEAVLPQKLSKESKSSQISELETSEVRVMEDQIEDRSSSIMSVRSFISEATPVKLMKEQSAESLTSASSIKTNMSAQSITSKVSEGTPVDVENKLLMERVPSAMSAKSDVSVRSKTSNILRISPHDSDVEDAIDHPAPSPKSNTSNTSSRSVTPMISTVARKEPDDVEKERLKRPSSNMSSKSSASGRSSKSNLREEGDNTEKTKHLHDGYITSVILSKPSDSELSKKSKTSKATLEKCVDFEHHSGEQVPSTKSTKSSKSEMLETCMGENDGRPLSAMSSKSSVSKKSGKSKLSESALECDLPEDRPASIMSSTSVKSKKSVVSDPPCENEEDETKQNGRSSQNALSVRSQRSRKSKASENPRKDTGNEDNREGASSTMSCQSILSDRSNLAPDGGDDTGPIKHSLKETERAYEETKNDRAASAMSSKSQISSLYNKSKDRIQERAPSSMSAKSNVSSKSKNSKVAQSKDEGEDRVLILASPGSNKSAGSKKSEPLAVVSPVEVENQSSERTPSAMSGKSNTSKSKKNTVSDCFKEPQKTNEEELVERSPSAVSAKSNASIRSKGSDTQSNRPMKNIHLNVISPKSSTSAKDICSIISNNSTNLDIVRSEETGDIKIEERAPSGMSAKSIVSSRSVKSNTLAGGHTDILSFNERSCNAQSGLKVSTTENSNNADNEERASSALSKKSKTNSGQHTSERVLTPASASVSIGIVEEYDVDNAEDSVSLVSVNSGPELNSKTDVRCKDSSKMSDNENQQCMQTPDDRAKSSLTAVTIVSDMSKKSECTRKDSSQPTADNEVASNTSAQKNSKKSSSHTLSSRSAHSYFGSSKTKERNCPAITDRPKTNMSNTLLRLEVNGQSKENSCVSSDRYSKKDEEEISSVHDVSITSVSTDNGLLRQKSKEPVISLGVPNHRSTPSNKKGNKLNTTGDLNVQGRTCNGSLVATDCSRNANDNNSEKNSNSSCRHSSSSLAQMEDNNTFELVPSILPSSSPTEVVNEWLKKIPLDSALYDVGDEFHENCEEELWKMSGKVTKYERGNGSEGDADAAELRPRNEQLQVENIENNGSKVGDVRKTSKNLAVVENIQPCTFPEVPSSVQLMRILLSPKLDRCNSLPEVSPVYGRKLSTSARGILDSLVNLQLLEFDPNDVNGKAEKYNDLMTMLQSLWLCDPSDRGKITQESKCNNQRSNTEEFNVKSSSEVDIDRSCQDSGKSSVKGCSVFKVAQESQTNTEGEDSEILAKGQEIDKREKAFKGIETKSDSATPDIASRVRWTPENEAEENMQESNVLSVVSDLTIRSHFSPRGPPDTASISNKSSGHDSNADEKLTDHEEDTSSETPSSEQMTRLTEKVSQDPDPVWVLNLLNKIEKQFMTHYVTAMAEFKVRWNLNDNEQLDAMIRELKDEVHKRIQASINSELRKFKGHAGRPRPPKETMSRESSILTGQRRRRLKLNLNQSIDLAAKTDDRSTADLMTELSDRRYDDEYCPCDTCMKKKTSRPVEVLNSAPVMIDFDLRKILHLKREAPLSSKENVKGNEEHHIEVGNLTENDLLESFKKDETQEIYKANVELQAMSTESITTGSVEQNESDTSDDKGYGKECSQAVMGNKPRGMRKGSSSSSLEDASDTHPHKSELKLMTNQPMKEKESPVAGDELRDHVELRIGAEILEMTNAEAIAEEENAHSGPAHMETEAKPTEDEVEICDELAEQKESVEAVREEHTTEAGTVKENMAIKAGTAGEQEAAEGESERKRTEAETSDTETRGETDEGETLEIKKGSLGERTSEDNEVFDGEISESESEGGEILDDEKEKHEDAKTETKWKNMSGKPDAGSTEGEAASKEIDTTVTDEPKVKSEIEEDEKETSDGIEDATDEEYESVEAAKRESTDNEESGEDEEEKNEHAEDGDITEHESAEEDNSMNDESGNEEETDNVELDAEGTTSKPETAADEEPAYNETDEYRENFYDGTSDRSETEEDGEPHNNLTTEDGETTGAKAADVGEMGEAKAAEGNDNESAEDAETSKSQTAEDTSDDDETAEFRERPEVKIAEGGEISDDEIAYGGGADDAVTGEDERAEDGDTDEDEISEIEEMPCSETADSEITTKDKTTEFEETQNEGTSDDGEDAGAVVADDEEAAEVPEENGNDTGDDRTEEPKRAKTEVAEEIVDTEIDEDTEGNVMKTEGEARDIEKTADGRANHDTAEDTEMDTSQSEEDGVTADDEADNGEIDDDRTTEDEKPSESDMEKVDTTEKDREQEVDGRTDEQVSDDEATVGTDSEENEETTEANTGEDGQTDDNGTEDRDTADEREAEDEELSENERAQNGEIAERITGAYVQMDESLKNGETAGEVSAEALESNPAEAFINTDVVKAKQKTEMSINQGTGTFESNRYNVNTPLINTGESDEGGDEAEDEIEPAVETNGRAQPAKWSLPKADKRTIALLDSAVKEDPGSEDGADADGEDSETEVHKDGSVENEEDD